MTTLLCIATDLSCPPQKKNINETYTKKDFTQVALTIAAILVQGQCAYPNKHGRLL